MSLVPGNPWMRYRTRQSRTTSLWVATGAKHMDFTALSVFCADCRVEIARDRFNQNDHAFPARAVGCNGPKVRTLGTLSQRLTQWASR